jgi:hypothetical protein
MNRSLVLLFALVPAFAAAQTGSPVVGTWTLTAADVIKSDGTRTADYGPNPRGQAIFTSDGHFSINVFRAQRQKFASKDRLRGTPEEYREAVITMSTLFGTYTVDAAKSTIALNVVSAAYPNFDDTTQLREYTLVGDVLEWRVPPRPDGSVPVSTFKRVR